MNYYFWETTTFFLVVLDAEIRQKKFKSIFSWLNKANENIENSSPRVQRRKREDFIDFRIHPFATINCNTECSISFENRFRFCEVPIGLDFSRAEEDYDLRASEWPLQNRVVIYYL